MKIGKYNFDTDNNVYVMGILNVTPDSFSDGNRFNDIDKALMRVKRMVQEGAAIIDVGGESTRPGYKMISCEEEIQRVCPVIERIVREFDVPVSVDTYKADVAQSALDAGALMVNDIHGLKYDDRMALVVEKNNASVCIMHNRKEAFDVSMSGEIFVENVLADLKESIEIARAAGIAQDKIMVDPGVGFAKSYEQNLIITNNVDKLKMLGYPVLLATSRKSMIGLTLDLPVEEREEGTIATTVVGVMKGVSFVRVHDVKKNIRAIKMTKAIIER